MVEQHDSESNTTFHAYIPGHTPRHKEGRFDSIRETAQPGMSVDELANSRAFLTGLDYLDTEFYWEAHEVLEPVWLALPDHSDEKHLVQALIQLANAHLKLRMNRPAATARLCVIVTDLLSPLSQAVVMSVSVAKLQQQVDELKKQV